MKITVNQTLHGYRNGHQLLATSADLTSDEKKILLFQSDLSGSNTTKGFDEYLTGYPIPGSNSYAFSKTWYAYEMNRPGCVWTHTIILRFPDLGKLPELKVLIEHFRRPIVDTYEFYNQPIHVEYHDLGSSRPIDFVFPNLYYYLYDFPNKNIVAPANNSKLYETEVLNIWSNQWPRLRRNFYFCTGAISLRSVNNRSYDLQIIPDNNSHIILRQRDDIEEVNTNIIPITDWMITLKKHSQNAVRQFLWTFGSDIAGDRSNYVPLIEMFNAIVNTPDLKNLSNVLKRKFPIKENAKLLKSKIFNENSITGIDELEIINFLCSEEDLSFIEIKTLSLEDRLIRLLITETITVEDFVAIKLKSVDGRIPDDIWQRVELTDGKVFDLIENDPQIFNLFIDKASTLASNPRLWLTSYDLQRKVLESIHFSNRIIDWTPYVSLILDAESNAIIDLYRLVGNKIVNLSLDWLNQNKSNLTFKKEWTRIIFSDNEYVLRKWLYEHEHGLNSKIWLLIFLNISNKKLQNLDFKHDTWINGYKKLKINSYNLNLPYVACTILSIGFNNKVRNAEWITTVTYADVYSFAENDKISYDVWGIVPKEIGDEDDEDYGLVDTILSIFRIKLKKQNQIPNWDYCEYLTRTLCNKFIQNNWNPQAFIDALKQPLLFDRAVKYCLTKKKGFNFLVKVHNHIANEKTVAEKFQTQFLKKVVEYKK